MRAVRALLVLLVAALAACGPGGDRAGRAPPAVSISPGAPARAGGQAFEAPLDARRVRVLFVGASVTEGWFASAPAHAYPALVVRAIAATGRTVSVRVVARPGATAEVASGWDLGVPSDLVVVQMATNDYVQGVPLEVFADSYAGVLRRLRAASPKAEMVCLGGWDDPAAPNRIGVAAAAYDEAARTACTGEDGDYVDLSAVYLDPRNHGPVGRPTLHGPGDEFHPNDRGHQELAALVMASIRVPDPSAPPVS